jgi:hypothetical protein
MRGYVDYIISPIGERYNNSKKIGDKELILNTEISNHQYINRLAKVIATPLLFQSPIELGDEVIVHHNVFRRWHNIRGEEKNSRSYISKNKYTVNPDLIFLYKKEEWKAMPGFTFVRSLKDTDDFSLNVERDFIGVVEYSDGTFNKNELIGFGPYQKVEYLINGKKLWRVMNQFIEIKYGHKRNQEEYNPSWAQSS